MPPQTRYSLYVLISAILAAFSWLLTEITLGFYQIDPIIAALGANLAGGLILLATRRRSTRFFPAWQWREWATVLAIALAIYTLAFQLSFNAVNLIGAGKVVLLGRLETIYVIVLAVLFLGETLSPRRLMAGGLAIIGAVLINFNPQAWRLTFGWGELLAVLAPLGVSTGIILYKPLLDRAEAGRVTGFALVFGAIFLIPLTPLAEAPLILGWTALLVIILMGLFRGAAWLIYNIALRHIGASRSAIIFISSGFFTVILQVVVAIIVPALGLRPPDNLITALLGGVLVALGIVVLQAEAR